MAVCESAGSLHFLEQRSVRRMEATDRVLMPSCRKGSIGERCWSS